MQYQFTRDITVDGRPHATGEVVDLDDLPRGSVDSLLRAAAIAPYERVEGPVARDEGRSAAQESVPEPTGLAADKPKPKPNRRRR